MMITRRLVASVLIGVLATVAAAQQPVPLADLVGKPRLPAGISEHPIRLNGQLAYLFKATDGTDVIHVVGDFLLSIGKGRGDGQIIQSREAVVWIEHRKHNDRAYRHLQVFMWGDGIVREIGRTITTGPALFVTLNTFGDISTNVDDFTFESSIGTVAYDEGEKIRTAIKASLASSASVQAPLRVMNASAFGEEPVEKPVKPVVFFQAQGDLQGPMAAGDGQVIIVTGGVYLSRGVAGAGDFVEVSAESVVVFLPADEDRPKPLDTSSPLGGERSTKEVVGAGGAGEAGDAEGKDSKRPRNSDERQFMATGFGNMAVDSVYLEGDVVMSQGPNQIRAERLYFDFSNDRALILDAVVRANMLERNIPLYLRAEEIRQLGASHFEASNAKLTTSEFRTPHYHIGADEVTLINRTSKSVKGRRGEMAAGSFQIRNASLNIGGVPITYWPFLRGSLNTSETSIKGIRTGFSDDFGMEIEMDLDFFNVLGLNTPNGFDSTLSLDYFSERGPGFGLDADYEQDRYFGELKSYVLFDEGEDNLGRDREDVQANEARGRILIRHRQYLDDDWQLSLELSYISDKSFLEEFFESEFDNGKDQETLLYLKKQRDDWAFTALLQSRLLDFYTQTERSPDLGFFVVGRSVGSATWYSENRLGFVRLRPADQTFRRFLQEGRTIGSGSTARFDSRQELSSSIDIGPLRLVPFASIRGTAWDDSPHAGGVARVFGTYGVRSSLYFWKTFPDFRSELFDIDGVRHIIKPDITAWVSHTNYDSHELFQFDETVEGINEVDGVTIGVRQRWQTKRGAQDNRRTVDFLTWDVDAGFFNDANRDQITNGFTSFSRPENSISQNYVNSSFIWRLNDRTALLSETNYDLNDGEIDIMNVSLAVERSPRLSYLIGYRFIEESNSNLIGFDLNYRLTEKHTMAIRERFDLEEARTLDFTVAFIRKFPRWFGALSLDLDKAEDDFGISFSLWPEGLPSAALGSRRFTGLGRGTTIEN